MLSPELNERMCRVDPGTPMGQALRRYWLPVLLGADLTAGGDPSGVEVAGERYVGYRDATGKVGLYAEACLHRGASMLMARAEPDGLRCIYHGWKFGVDSQVLDTPNVADPRFKERIKGRTYPVREAGGLIWAYLGPREHEPAFPWWPWMDLPAAQCLVTRHVEECNFVQVLEGLVDSSHLGILHSDGLRQSGETALAFAQKVSSMQRNVAPQLAIEETDFGFYYAALRDMGDDTAPRIEGRVAAFVAPCTVLNPNGDIATISVPVSDTQTAFFHVFWSATERINEEPLRGKHLAFVGLTADKLDEFGITPQTLGRKDRPNPRNAFMQNREAMRSGASWSGLPGLIEEDVAVSVSAGPIRGRSNEMLSSADLAVSRIYRVLLRCADAVAQGLAPVGLERHIDWSKVVGAHGDVTPQRPWQALVPARPQPASAEAQQTGVPA